MKWRDLIGDPPERILDEEDWAMKVCDKCGRRSDVLCPLKEEFSGGGLEICSASYEQTVGDGVDTVFNPQPG